MILFLLGLRKDRVDTEDIKRAHEKRANLRGKRDFADGLNKSDNPFGWISETAKSLAWEAGWTEAKLELLKNGTGSSERTFENWLSLYTETSNY